MTYLGHSDFRTKPKCNHELLWWCGWFWIHWFEIFLIILNFSGLSGCFSMQRVLGAYLWMHVYFIYQPWKCCMKSQASMQQIDHEKMCNNLKLIVSERSGCSHSSFWLEHGARQTNEPFLNVRLIFIMRPSHVVLCHRSCLHQTHFLIWKTFFGWHVNFLLEWSYTEACRWLDI